MVGVKLAVIFYGTCLQEMDGALYSWQEICDEKILLPPKHSIIFKNKVNIPVPSLLFFSDSATCITSAAASLTTKSSFCSSRITHFHRPRVSDSPIFICGENLEFYFLYAFKEVRELCFHTYTRHMKGIGKPLGKRLAILSTIFSMCEPYLGGRLSLV